MAGLLHDLHAAARGLRREPAYAIAAIGTLAIAIAVNAAMFSFINAAFFRPFPYPALDRLIHVRVDMLDAAAASPRIGDARDAVLPGGRLAAYEERRFVLGGEAGEGATLVQGTRLEPDVLRMLDLEPVAGRSFDEGDALIGAEPVVLLAEDLAVTRFGAARAALGERVRLDGVEHRVVGVLVARTAFPHFARLWVPMTGASQLPAAGGPALLGRLDATDAVTVTHRIEGLAAAGVLRVRVEAFRPRAEGTVAVLLTALAFLLLIACSNVSNLVLVRATSRRHELGVKAALGASRARLLRGLMAEGMVLAAAATVAGGIAGVWLTDALVALLPADEMPLWFEASLDFRVLAWLAGGAALTVLVVSGMPGLSLTRGRLTRTLGESGVRTSADAGSGRLRSSLVAVQIALATLLLTGTAGMARRWVDVQRFDPGYDAGSVLQLETRQAAGMGSSAFVREAELALRALGGAGEVAVRMPSRTRGALFSGDGQTMGQVSFEVVSPGFFSTIGLSLRYGRVHTDAESQEGQVALIGESVASRLYGDAASAVGAPLGIETEQGRITLTVVGVVESRRVPLDGGLEGFGTAHHVYLPQAHGEPTAAEFLVRPRSGSPLALATPAVRALDTAGRDVVIRQPRTLADFEFDERGDVRFFATIFGGFGALALALAAIGIYGVVAFTVGQRTREIGVRVTLGATGPRVVGEVLRRVLPATLIGLGAGTAGALGVNAVLRGTFFGWGDGPPVALLLALAVFFFVALLAAWIPARRAARIDPVAALRTG